MRFIAIGQRDLQHSGLRFQQRAGSGGQPAAGDVVRHADVKGVAEELLQRRQAVVAVSSDVLGRDGRLQVALDAVDGLGEHFQAGQERSPPLMTGADRSAYIIPDLTMDFLMI